MIYDNLNEFNVPQLQRFSRENIPFCFIYDKNIPFS